VAELVAFGSAKFADARKKPKPQIFGADIMQKVRIEGFVCGFGTANHDALATARRFVQLTCASVFVRHARRCGLNRIVYDIMS
jgi:hypothetical protein